MLGVLSLFVIPVGGGIPAGVLLAQHKGIAWPVTMFLYFVSDLFLAVAFEPFVMLVGAAGRRFPGIAKVSEAFKLSLQRTAALYGKGRGPFTLVLVAFGVDPMTGRAAAAAAGHGFVGGWAIAITGDMMYFAVVMLATLRLSAYFGDPERTVMVVLAAMVLIPLAVRKVRDRLAARP